MATSKPDRINENVTPPDNITNENTVQQSPPRPNESGGEPASIPGAPVNPALPVPLQRELSAAIFAEDDLRRAVKQHEDAVNAGKAATDAVNAYKEALSNAGDGALPPIPGAPADNMPGNLPRGFYLQPTSYIVEEFEILASTRDIHTTSYMLDATSVTADANGDKIVKKGTTVGVMASNNGKGKPRAGAEVCIGVTMYSVNLREGDEPIALIRGGRLRSDKLTDAGVFGTVAASAITDLRNLGVYLTTIDGG